MDTSFLFLDESFLQSASLSSLTGLVIPVRLYDDLRTRFYRILPRDANPNVLNAQPPELHGSSFLRNEPDATKLRVLNELVDLITGYHITIYRIGYMATDGDRKRFDADYELYGLCWLGLLSTLQPVLRNGYLIPVMDGLDKHIANKFSIPVRTANLMRAFGPEEGISVRNTSNIVGEVFYANSEFSVGTQLADIVNYLRSARDHASLGDTITEFKAKLLQISNKLEPSINADVIRYLEFDAPGW